ncbi:hypothetical protein A2U01_0060393 [Trifolium medium]|uniref:Uncharacterized protein n=1 Tax=Trifolium medium TaxID=97028 RepID=A0A392RSH9_9FABA|nr:hypothetical protein [Trifolium medium]
MNLLEKKYDNPFSHIINQPSCFSCVFGRRVSCLHVFAAFPTASSCHLRCVVDCLITRRRVFAAFWYTVSPVVVFPTTAYPAAASPVTLNKNRQVGGGGGLVHD